MIKKLKIISKVHMTFMIFIVLALLFTLMGFIILLYFHIDTNLEFGIKILITILAVLFALFLSIKSFKSKKCFKRIMIGFISIIVIDALYVLIYK